MAVDIVQECDFATVVELRRSRLKCVSHSSSFTRMVLVVLSLSGSGAYIDLLLRLIRNAVKGLLLLGAHLVPSPRKGVVGDQVRAMRWCLL